MLNSLGASDLSHNEIPLPTHQCGYYQNTKTQTIASVGEDVEKLGPWRTAGGKERKMVQPRGEQCGESPELHRERPQHPVIVLLGIYPREWKTGTQTGTFTPTFVKALFTKWGQHLEYALTDGRRNRCGLPTMERYSAFEKQ